MHNTAHTILNKTLTRGRPKFVCCTPKKANFYFLAEKMNMHFQFIIFFGSIQGHKITENDCSCWHLNLSNQAADSLIFYFIFRFRLKKE